MEFQLVEFGGNDSGIEIKVQLIPNTEARRLRLRYEVFGDTSKIVWPEKQVPDFKEELWKESCFEAFYFSSSGEDYIELNFSPSGCWWAAKFSSYRKKESSLPDGFDPNIKFANEGSIIYLQADIPLQENTKLGIAAILKTEDRQYHFALQHQGERPDFHRASDAFIELGDLKI